MKNGNETIEQCFHKKVSLVCLRQLPEDKVVDHIIAGVNDEPLVWSLSTAKFATPESLLECPKRLDNRLVIERASK